jgi:hypothetical protein
LIVSKSILDRQRMINAAMFHISGYCRRVQKHWFQTATRLFIHYAVDHPWRGGGCNAARPAVMRHCLLEPWFHCHKMFLLGWSVWGSQMPDRDSNLNVLLLSLSQMVARGIRPMLFLLPERDAIETSEAMGQIGIASNESRWPEKTHIVFIATAGQCN